MLRKLRLPSPAMVIAMVSLFVALTSTGWAQKVVPLAKRALTADKAKVATDAATLNGQSAAQIAGTPGPASSLPAGSISYRTQSWSVEGLDQSAQDTAQCLSGEKVIGGGWDQDRGGIGYVLTDRPVPDGSGWRVRVFGQEANDLPASGTMWAVCLKTS